MLSVLFVCLWFGWVANSRQAYRRHASNVHRICRQHGAIELASHTYSGNPYALFPELDWYAWLLPWRNHDPVVAVSFQNANGAFGRRISAGGPVSWENNESVEWITPDWSKESMLELSEPLESFAELKRLDFSRTTLPRHGLACLRNLRQLTTLDLQQTQITGVDLQYLANLENLTWLSLRRTRVDNAGLQHISELPKLQTLILGSTRVGDAGIEQLVSLPRLQELWLDNSLVTDDGMRQICRLPQLRELRIDTTRVTDHGLVHLESLTSLETLVVGGRISHPAVERLQAKLPNCTIMNVEPLMDE